MAKYGGDYIQSVTKEGIGDGRKVLQVEVFFVKGETPTGEYEKVVNN